ncbi:hypothetical protein EK904_014450 [Melospiza melodia maxima]|nr:hypothetical protein EK904_014450 [Melospiza melodia maxima]
MLGSTEAERYKGHNISNSPVVQKVIFIPVETCQYMSCLCHYSLSRAAERHNEGKDHFCFQFVQQHGVCACHE